MRRLVVSTALGLGVFAGGAATVALAAHEPGTAVPAATAKRTERLEEVLDPLVKDGTITEAQRDKVIGALQAAKPGHGDKGAHGRGPGGAPGRIVKAGLAEAAKIIGIDEATLRTELATRSLADVAKARGVDRQKLLDGLVAAATTRIDQAVADARLTQAQADELKKDLPARIGEQIDKVGRGGLGKGKAGRGHGPRRPDGAAPSTTSPSPPTTVSLRTS